MANQFEAKNGLASDRPSNAYSAAIGAIDVAASVTRSNSPAPGVPPQFCARLVLTSCAWIPMIPISMMGLSLMPLPIVISVRVRFVVIPTRLLGIADSQNEAVETVTRVCPSLVGHAGANPSTKAG